MGFNRLELKKRLASSLVLVALGAWGILGGKSVLYGISLCIEAALIVEWFKLSGSFSIFSKLAGYSVLFIFAYCWLGLIHAQEAIALFLYSAVASFGADTAAYIGGKLLKTPPFAPRISPKKTWGGALSGLVVGTLAATPLLPYQSTHPALCLIFSVGAVTAGIGGDLTESWCKRRAGIKDSSQLLPGHGGFLDRFDSFIAVVVFLSVAIKPWM